MPSPSEGFFAVVSPDFGPSVLLQRGTLEELLVEIKKFQESYGTQVFVFDGKHLPITKPPRHLITDGGPVPLFDTPTELEIDQEGLVGEPLPKVAEALSAPNPTDEDHDDEDDVDVDQLGGDDADPLDDDNMA